MLQWKSFSEKIRQSLEVEDIFQAISPISRTCKVFGLNPSQGEGNFTLTGLMHPTFVILFLLVSNVLLRPYSQCRPPFCKRATIAVIMFPVTYFIILISVWSTFVRPESLPAALRRIDALRIYFKGKNLKINLSKRYLIKFVLFIITLAVTVGGLTTPQQFSSALRVHVLFFRITQFLPIFIVFCLFLMIEILMDALIRHFVFITKNLKLISKCHMSRKEKLYEIENLALIHNELCEIADILEEGFGTQVFLVFAACLLNLVSLSYLVGLSAFKFLHGSGESLLDFCMTSLAFGVWAYPIPSLITPSNQCSVYAEEFTLELYRIIMEDVTKDLLKSNKLCLHILMKREVHFTAGGFFRLDNTLIHSMAGATATYLIVLLQV